MFFEYDDFSINGPIDNTTVLSFGNLVKLLSINLQLLYIVCDEFDKLKLKKEEIYLGAIPSWLSDAPIKITSIFGSHFVKLFLILEYEVGYLFNIYSAKEKKITKGKISILILNKTCLTIQNWK